MVEQHGTENALVSQVSSSTGRGRGLPDRSELVEPFDIAAVAALALTRPDQTRPGHDHAVYRLTGPEAVLPADRIRILARLLGRDLHLRPLADDEARAEPGATMPPEYVDAFVNFFVDGAYDDAVVLPTTSELLGRPARTFRRWAEAHADAFR